MAEGANEEEGEGEERIEMDDVTGNFGCVLWFGIRVSALSIRPYLYWSFCHFQILKKSRE